MSVTGETLLSALRRQGVVPVISIEDPAQAVALARSHVEAGSTILEYTLRAPQALQAIAEVIRQVPAAIVGVGSVLSPKDMADAAAVGARFLVSPGQTPALLQAGAASPLPYIPGAATASEVMQAREAGFRLVKFFPARHAGGPEALAALAAPLADMAFMPTGGIAAADVEAWLRLPCVVCCGRSSGVARG